MKIIGAIHDRSGPRRPLRVRAARWLAVGLLVCATAGAAYAEVRITLTDGRVVVVEEAWEDAHGVWYRRDGVTQLLDRSRVQRIERVEGRAETKASAKETETVAAVSDAAPVTWIHLVGGARMRVDEAAENADGVWYRRGNLSLLLDRARVERVEIETAAGAHGAAPPPGAGNDGWTTGREGLDALIRRNAARHGVDPYLIFLVMEQESRFNPRAVSRAGARGLMQLMPGTAARFGVRDSFDPAQNVSAGTRYLKELLGMFGGQVDLVLAGYNAGEGAVMRYGNRVPPFRETRNYVKRIGERYGKGGSRTPTGKTEPIPPQK